MAPIRVHLGPMPQMLRAIVGDLLGQEPDIQVLGGRPDDQDALRSAVGQHADILIVQDGQQEDNHFFETILSGTLLGICALSADGRHASAVNLVRRDFELESDRPFALADAVRAMARTTSAPHRTSREG